MKFYRASCILALSLCLVQATGFSLPKAGIRASTVLASSTLSKPVESGITKSDDLPSIVPFGGSAPPQAKPDKHIVGGKGVGLQEMSRIGGKLHHIILFARFAVEI
jgi:hypothetical protein